MGFLWDFYGDLDYILWECLGVFSTRIYLFLGGVLWINYGLLNS